MPGLHLHVSLSCHLIQRSLLLTTTFITTPSQAHHSAWLYLMPCWPATSLFIFISSFFLTITITMTIMGLPQKAAAFQHHLTSAAIVTTTISRRRIIITSQNHATRTSKSAFHFAAHSHTRTLPSSFPAARRRTTHQQRLLTMSITTGNNNNKAKEYTIHIPDTTLPNTPLRPVHVLDTGIPTHPPNHPHTKPPLILIGGTAQTTQSWVGHIQPLSKERRLIIYEARGQGRKTDLNLKRGGFVV